MNRAQMSQKMNQIARTASSKVKAVVAPIKRVADKGMDMVVGPVENKMRKMDETRAARNTQMIQDNFPGGMKGYSEAAEKRAATKASIKALGGTVTKNLADKGLVRRTKNIDGVYKIK